MKKKWQITNESRPTMFVPIPTVIIGWGGVWCDFGISFGWLFFAVEIEYRKAGFP